MEEPLFEDPYVIVCRREHPLTRLQDPESRDLAGFEWVHPTVGLPRRDVLDRLTAGWGLSPRVQFETNCLATITSLLATSDRLSILSRWHVALDERLARLDRPAIPHERREVGLTCRANWLPTPFQLRFVERLRGGARATAELSDSAELG
jgi:DNA-binding transcriptional LysR family regulator